LLVHPALEGDNLVRRVPVVHPGEAIEFRLVTQVKAYAAAVGQQAQQEPALLLPDAHGLGALPDQVGRQAVAQPLAGPGHNLDVARPQADFLAQLAEGGRLRRFVPLYATLGKLPGILTDAFRPQHLALIVEDDEPDVGPEAIRIYHTSQPYLAGGPSEPCCDRARPRPAALRAYCSELNSV